MREIGYRSYRRMKMKRKIIFFDFDGVIADSFSIGFEINKTIDPLVSVGTEDDYRKLFDGNINDWGKNSSVSEKEVERINKEFFERYIPQMERVKMFPGMKEVIANLAKTHILFIVSSTIISPLRDFLNRNNILSYFHDIVGSNFIDANKTERIKAVFKKYGAEAKDCVFITDTLGDIREASSVGVQSIGVSWGFQDRENLLKGSPFSIAEKPGDLLGIVSDCFKEK